MEESGKYLQQLKEIEQYMKRSTRFLSISGWSSMLVGAYALLGGTFVFFLQSKVDLVLDFSENKEDLIYLTAFLVLGASLATGFLMALKKAKKNKEKIWSTSSKQFLMAFGIPMLTGGIFALLLLFRREILIISPVTLLFYGLALFNASSFSYKSLRVLGIVFILLGLMNTFFIGLGIFFWVTGFGIAHIIYGIYMLLYLEKN